MNFLKSCFEGLNQAVRQVSNEAHSVKHQSHLSTWHTETLVGCVQRLEEQVFRLKVSSCAQIH